MVRMRLAALVLVGATLFGSMGCWRWKCFGDRWRGDGCCMDTGAAPSLCCGGVAMEGGPIVGPSMDYGVPPGAFPPPGPTVTPPPPTFTPPPPRIVPVPQASPYPATPTRWFR